MAFNKTPLQRRGGTVFLAHFRQVGVRGRDNEGSSTLGNLDVSRFHLPLEPPFLGSEVLLFPLLLGSQPVGRRRRNGRAKANGAISSEAWNQFGVRI